MFVEIHSLKRLLADDSGGAIQSSARLEINGSLISANEAVTGPAISNTGIVTLWRVVFDSNTLLCLGEEYLHAVSGKTEVFAHKDYFGRFYRVFEGRLDRCHK